MFRVLGQKFGYGVMMCRCYKALMVIRGSSSFEAKPFGDESSIKGNLPEREDA